MRFAVSFGRDEKRATGCGSCFRRSPDWDRAPTSLRFAISSLEEASAYLAHPILGPRLSECATLVLSVEGRSAPDIFGPVDSMKFRSSMTLFATADPALPVYRYCLEKYFAGAPDPATLARI